MTQWMRSWVLSVTCAAMAAAVLRLFLPKGAVRRVGQLAGGLFLLAAALGPIAQVGTDGVFTALSLAGADLRAQSYEAVQETWRAEIEKQLIAEQTQAYIQDKAAELGIRCRAEVFCGGAEGIALAPSAVEVLVYEGAAQSRRLAQLIEKDLGIPQEKQVYREEVAP